MDDATHRDAILERRSAIVESRCIASSSASAWIKLRRRQLQHIFWRHKYAGFVRLRLPPLAIVRDAGRFYQLLTEKTDGFE